MLRSRRAWAVVAALLLPLQAAAADADACRTAGLEAERKMDLPPGLLAAIGMVETGRRDPASGQMTAWPWSINANGVDGVFATQAEAKDATMRLQGQGVRSIDVGCFQINLFHHATAFATLDEAFNPLANALYAARFLVDLRGRTGSWDSAIAAYHSSNPDHGIPYHDRVMTRWNSGAVTAVADTGLSVTVEIWRPAMAGDKIRIWVPQPAGHGPRVITIMPEALQHHPAAIAGM